MLLILGRLIREVQEKGEIATQSIGDSHRGCAKLQERGDDIGVPVVNRSASSVRLVNAGEHPFRN